MNDVAFETFRAKLADAVTVAINSEAKPRVAPNGGTHCPLGCFPGVRHSRPLAVELEGRGMGSEDDFAAFMQGFDSGPKHPMGYSGPYFDLGVLYRERFTIRPSR